MKRFFLLLFIILAIGFTEASAQSGLNIEPLFTSDFTRDARCKSTLIRGDRVAPFSLRLYRSLSLTGMPGAAPQIEAKVRKDGARATDKEVSYKAGRLAYGFYTLPPAGGMNRYIFYLNSGADSRNKIVLLYMEGEATASEIRKMLKK